MKLNGSFVALVTPFRQGEIDYTALTQLIEWQIAEGTDGLVICGTTGESATLSLREKQTLIQFTVEQVAQRIPVIAGTGSYNTRETIELTAYAEEVGASAVLLVSPYYNKPTAEGLYLHYSAIAREVSIPMVLYNVPGRTAQNIPLEVLTRLEIFESIVAIKEAVSDLGRVSEILNRGRFSVFSGEDGLTFPMMALGASGVISVVANIFPRQMMQMTRACLEGQWDEARKWHFSLLPVCQALFLESNPIPVKYVLASWQKIEEEYRLPLCSASLDTKVKIDRKIGEAQQKFGLVPPLFHYV